MNYCLSGLTNRLQVMSWWIYLVCPAAQMSSEVTLMISGWHQNKQLLSILALSIWLGWIGLRLSLLCAASYIEWNTSSVKCLQMNLSVSWTDGVLVIPCKVPQTHSGHSDVCIDLMKNLTPCKITLERTFEQQWSILDDFASCDIITLNTSGLRWSVCTCLYFIHF